MDRTYIHIDRRHTQTEIHKQKQIKQIKTIKQIKQIKQIKTMETTTIPTTAFVTATTEFAKQLNEEQQKNDILKKELAKAKADLSALREANRGIKRKLDEMTPTTVVIAPSETPPVVTAPVVDIPKATDVGTKTVVTKTVVEEAETEDEEEDEQEVKAVELEDIKHHRIKLLNGWKQEAALFNVDQILQTKLALKWVRKCKLNKTVYVQKSCDDDTLVPVYTGDIVEIDNWVVKQQYGTIIKECYVVGVYSFQMTRVNSTKCTWTNKFHGSLYANLQSFRNWFESFDTKKCVDNGVMIRRPIVELAPLSDTQKRYHLPIAFGDGQTKYDTGIRIYKSPNNYAVINDKIKLIHPNCIYAHTNKRTIHGLFRWGATRTSAADGHHMMQKHRYKTLYDAWCKAGKKQIVLTKDMVRTFIPDSLGNVRIPFDYFDDVKIKHDFYLYPNQYKIERN